MTQILQRALPFVVTLVFGVTVSAIVSTVLPLHQRMRLANQYAGSDRYALVEITEIDTMGGIHQVPFTIANSHSSTLTLKEQALFFRALQEEANSNDDITVSYTAPESIDRQPVTVDAVVGHVPWPDFRSNESNRRRVPYCKMILRVDLDASGAVSRVETVPGLDEACPYTGDVLDAAKRIYFQPATRNGVPVTQRMAVLYRLPE